MEVVHFGLTEVGIEFEFPQNKLIKKKPHGSKSGVFRSKQRATSFYYILSIILCTKSFLYLMISSLLFTILLYPLIIMFIIYNFILLISVVVEFSHVYNSFFSILVGSFYKNFI